MHYEIIILGATAAYSGAFLKTRLDDNTYNTGMHSILFAVYVNDIIGGLAVNDMVGGLA